METMTREKWNEAYAARMVERAGMTMEEGLSCADCVEGWFEDGEDPSDSADEEMSCWDNDE